MSLADDAKLLLIPTGYKTSKVYSVFPTDGDGDFTYTRSGDASRVNPGGLIETVGTNIPRIDHLGGSCPTLLLEPQRTNLVYPNTNLSGYGINNGVKSDNVIISPDGQNNGSLVQSNGGGTCVVYKSFSTSTNTTYNISVFLKKGNYNNIRLQEGFTNSQMVVDLSNGTEVSSVNATNKKIEDYGNGWYRVSFNYTSHSSISLAQYSVYINGSTASGNTFYTFGGQIEQGSYPTSYIKTEGSAVTRLKDDCHLLNQTLFTDYPFTVYAKAKADAIGNAVFGLNNTASSSYYLFFSFVNALQIGVTRGTIGANDLDYYNFSYSVGDTLKIAVVFVSPTAYKLYINGAEIANVTSGTSIPFNHDDISLGQLRITGDTGTRNSIDDFRVYNYTLTDNELTELTTL